MIKPQTPYWSQQLTETHSHKILDHSGRLGDMIAPGYVGVSYYHDWLPGRRNQPMRDYCNPRMSLKMMHGPFYEVSSSRAPSDKKGFR